MAKRAAIAGAGPAGLMAAETLSAHGWRVTIYDQMPSAARKFLMAGRGGLNLTHSEPLDRFVDRYDATEWVRAILTGFTPSDLVAWARGLGQETFVGSSGRVFPKTMKASPLLRAWLRRLDNQGVEFRFRHRWRGWDESGALWLETPDGPVSDSPDATILALGGASWPKLGSDGSWADILRARGVPVLPFVASNCGVIVDWSEVFRTRFAGTPLNNVAVTVGGRRSRGEAVVTAYGLEGGAIYALSKAFRDELGSGGQPALSLDLRPDISGATLTERLDMPRRGESASNFLRKRIGLSPVAVNVLREAGADLNACDPSVLARAIKSVELSYRGLAPIERAISTAGGLKRDVLGQDLRILNLDRIYAVGEMIDWDAPTGGYLLQLCFASGVHAARRICGI